MIKNKDDLKYFISQDMKYYHDFDKREKIIRCLTNDSSYELMKYVKFLRKEEYYYNSHRTIIDTFFYLFYFNKKNRLGNKLGIKIPRNCFDCGLSIEHHGAIIVNENAIIGKNAKLHGMNCIGNNGTVGNAPIIGDDMDLGVGAVIIGDVKLGDDIKIGANAVVNKSFNGDCTVAGVPAHLINGNIQ